MQPGSYAPYPNPRPREIDFGVIAESYKIIMANLWPFVAGSLMLGVIYGMFEAGMFFAIFALLGAPPTDQTDTAALMNYAMREYAIIIPSSLIYTALIAPVCLSFTHMGLKCIRGQKAEVGDLAFGFSRWGQAFVLVIGHQIASMLGVIACFVGSYWVGGRLMLGLAAQADKGGSPMDNFRESWDLTGPHMWMAMLFWFVIALVAGMGVLACCVGILVTVPMLFVCTALIYRDLTGMHDVQPPSEFAEYPTQPQ